MASSRYRIAVIGAASLLGKEIAEELTAALPTAEVILLDHGAEDARLDQVAGEATLVRGITQETLEGIDAAVFASAEDAGRFGEELRGVGVAVVDATGTLKGVSVRTPQLEETAAVGLSGVGLETTAVAAAHPVTVMLAAVLRRANSTGRLRAAFATVLQPASHGGAEALDELHRQTVALLSFQTVPQEYFGEQAAFNLLPRYGEESKADLSRGAAIVGRELETMLSDGVVQPQLAWLQAPVFHGFAVSLFLEFEEVVAHLALEAALDRSPMEAVRAGDEAATNVRVAGEAKIFAELQITGSPAGRTHQVWLVADNLKLAAQTAAAAAVELLRLRPLPMVQ